jgi:hypothetical protein
MNRLATHIFLIFLLLICIVISMNAQQNSFIGGAFINTNGIEFNGNSSQFWNSSSETTSIEGTLGLSVGLFVKREFTSRLYSTIEFRYINKGSIYEFLTEYSTQSFKTVCLDYLEFPILVGYKTRLVYRTYCLESGLAFARLMGSNLKSLSNSTSNSNVADFKKNDISWICSLKFPLFMKWKDKLLFGLRVSRSIMTIHKIYKIYNFDYGIEFDYNFN